MTFLKDATVQILELGISIFTLFLPVRDSHVQDLLGMVYASLVILFNCHSLKVLYPLGLKWMDIVIWMDVLLCCTRKQELAAPIPTAETASWRDHVWFRPHVIPASETSVGFEKPKGLLHRGHTGKRPTRRCKASKQPPCAACGIG